MKPGCNNKSVIFHQYFIVHVCMCTVMDIILHRGLPGENKKKEKVYYNHDGKGIVIMFQLRI